MDKKNTDIVVYSAALFSIVYAGIRFGVEAFIIISVVWMMLYQMDIGSLIAKE